MDINIRAADASTWSDFERLFESPGGPSYCWCTVWRNKSEGGRPKGKAEKKSCIQAHICSDTPSGLLAYSEGEPIAWCSVAPRESHRKLGGDESKKEVWSLTCFYIKRKLRGKGIYRRLIAAAIEYARQSGAHWLEAYPVQTDSPSYLFMGFIPQFEEAGFHFVKSAGTRRKVMLLEL